MNETIKRLMKIAKSHDIQVFGAHIPACASMSIVSDRRYYIAIDLNAAASSADLNVKAAHELGHCRTGSFYNIHSPYDVRAKHEYRADKWAVHELIPFDKYQEALRAGYTEVWQLAEFFDVTEDFIRRAIYIYQCEQPS